MLLQLLTLMAFQLAGELLAGSLHLMFPGVLCGLLLMLGWLYLTGGPSEHMSVTSAILVDHLALLFVPAGSAIVGFGALLLSDGFAIGAALLISTGLGILIAGSLGSARPSQRMSTKGAD
jgi:holin-like protein